MTSDRRKAIQDSPYVREMSDREAVRFTASIMLGLVGLAVVIACAVFVFVSVT